MEFLELIGLSVLLYYAISIFLWIYLDSNIELAFKKKFGSNISTLRGQVVWITGASSGIGKALAIELAKHGVRLALSARRTKELQVVREECLAEANGLLSNDDVFVLPMDVLNLPSHSECLSHVIDHFGGLDILVNNAGRSQRALWDEIDIQVDREVFELDVFAVIHLSRKVVQYFKTKDGQKRRGHLAVTSSGAGFISVPYSASYCGAKHAIHGYFEALKMEDPTMPITLFCPGPIATSFLEEAFTDKPDLKLGQSTVNDRNRMSAERCAELFASALANKIFLSWCGLFPVNFLIYIALNFPSLGLFILRVIGKRGIKKIREGK